MKYLKAVVRDRAGEVQVYVRSDSVDEAEAVLEAYIEMQRDIITVSSRILLAFEGWMVFWSCRRRDVNLVVSQCDEYGNPYRAFVRVEPAC